MHLEERQELLEREVEALKSQLAHLLNKGAERWATPTELAQMMGCSRNTIYVKIRTGEIRATRATGAPRIPMSQFYNEDPIKATAKPRKEKANQSLHDKVFG